MKIEKSGSRLAWLALGAIALTGGVADAQEQQAPVVQETVSQSPAPAAAPVPSASTVWKDGFKLEAANDVASMRVGGRIQADASVIVMSHAMRAANGGPASDYSGFRRVRFLFEGAIFRHVEYWNEIEVASGTLRFADTYLGLKDGPGGLGLRIGHFKEPYGLEEQTSDSFVTFLERSLPNVFSPVRNFGAMVYADRLMDGKATVAAGLFREVGDNAIFGDSVGERDAGQANFTTRITLAPVLENGGEQLLHLGFGYTRKEYPGEFVSFSVRPETGFFNMSNAFTYTGATGACPPPVPPDTAIPACAYALPISNGTVLNTGNISGVRWGQTFNPELAVSVGPFSVQGEYMLTFLDTPAGNRYFQGAYGQVGYFLTGEHRPYSRGRFGRVKTDTAAFIDGGMGAIETAFRVSYLDLNNGPVNGGHAHSYTAVLNWYLNANTRFSGNYVHTTTSHIAPPGVPGSKLTGYVNSFVVRFQVDI